MFLRYIFKYMRRSAVTNLLYALLLTLSGALLALAAGLWYSVDKSERDLENLITTIAVPDVSAIRRYAKNYVKRNKLTEYETEWGTVSVSRRNLLGGYDAEYAANMLSPYVQIDVLKNISERVYGSGLFKMDDRRVYGAYAEGIESVPARLTTYGNTDAFVERSPQSVAAFVVACEGVDDVYEMTQTGMVRAYVAHFTVEQNLYLHHGRRLTRTVTGYFPNANADGSPPVEAGKRYAVMGYNFAQGDVPPTWYWALPYNKNLPNALYMDVLGEVAEPVQVDEAKSLGYFNTDVMRSLVMFGVSNESFELINPDIGGLYVSGGGNTFFFSPVILSRLPRYDAELGYEGVTWFELDGSLEDALASPRGDFIRTALSVAEISYNSLQVLTTDDLNSYLRFNQRTARMQEGRNFNPQEIASGARVCVVSRQLADINRLSPGDILPLRLYPTSLTQISVGNNSAWPPNPYHPKMNLTEPVAYEIIGIYQGPTQEMNDHAVSPNSVFVPAASFAGVGGPPTDGLYGVYGPPLLDTMIVPNGRIAEARALIENTAEGYGMFFRFYDQGYSALKPVLANLRMGMTWIFALAGAGWLVAGIMFSLFYIGRKRQETALLHAVGVKRGRRARWVFIQCAAVILLAQGAIVGTALPLYGNILNSAVSAAETFTDSYRDYRLSEMDEAGGLQLRLPLDKTAAGLVWAAAGEGLLLLTAAGIFSLRAAKPLSLADRKAGD